MKTNRLIALVSLVSLMMAGTARADEPDEIDVEAIQQAIEEAAAGWTAGHTPMTVLDAEERAMYLMDPEEAFAGTPTASAWKSDPPPPPPPDPDPTATRFSWHDYEGEDWLTDIRSQGACGGCWAFASLAAVEGTYNVSIGEPNLDIDLSEQVIISCTSGGCSGGMPEPVVQYLRTTGVPDEQCYPYTQTDGDCDAKCADWESRAFRVTGWGWVFDFFDQEQEIKDRLMYGPVYSSMTVYADFSSYTGGVYEHVWGESEGGHAVTIVGWDDSHDSWIVRNSWGTGWGESGYFEIRRGDSNIGQHVVYVTVDAENLPGHPCLEPRHQTVDVVAGGSPVDVTVSMVNCGGAPLAWSTEGSPGGATWLSVGPVNGAAAVGAGETFTATIDPSGMTTSGLTPAAIVVHGGIGDAVAYIDVMVETLPLDADFEATPTSGPAPLEVSFTNTSVGTVTNSDWTFGDGDGHNGRNATHTYDDEGVYTVSLRVSGPDGLDTEEKTDYITVLPPGSDPVPDEIPDEVPDPSPDADTDVIDDPIEDVAGEEDGGGGADPGCGCALVF